VRWRPSVADTAILVILTFGSFAVVQGIKLQQLSLVVNGIMAASAAALVGGQFVLAGVLLALATFKPQLALPMASWLALWSVSDWRRRQGFVWSFAITMAVLLAGSEYVLPGWISRFRDAVSAYSEYTQGASSLLEVLTTPAIGKILVAATILLAVFALPMLAIGLLIRLTSRGPALFRQQRIGKDGKPFRMLKFRTMHVHTSGEAESPRKADDPRITPIGRWLRRFSLDELPQLINVLRGEMSLVGPRPERPSFVEEFRRRVPGYMLRHKMKAGITGWAQINGWRGNTSIEKRIEYDLEYIARWSLRLDLTILFKTLWLGFHNRNAY
jgi:lipopolysaccharide/colanic/teichoic acid biosynthesis glycosyltransferase